MNDSKITKLKHNPSALILLEVILLGCLLGACTSGKNDAVESIKTSTNWHPPITVIKSTQPSTPTIPSVAIHQMGTVTLFTSLLNPDNKDEAYFDLDTGEIRTDITADIYYYVSRGSMAFNISDVVNEAKSQELADVEPGFEGCYQTMLLSPHNDFGLDISRGIYTCLLTNEGRLAQVRVDDVEYYGGEGRLAISFVTWSPIVVSLGDN